MEWKKERRETVKYAKRLYRKGFVSEGSGNLSLRVNENSFLITPHSKCYEKLNSDDIVLLDLEGNLINGHKTPSSEKYLHIEIYKARDDVKAIIHTHSSCTCVLAALEMPLPVILDEQLDVLGEKVRVTKYAPPGSIELAKEALKELNKNKAVILARHGLVAVGNSMKEAYHVCELVEKLSKIYLFMRLLAK